VALNTINQINSDNHKMDNSGSF